MDNYHYVSKVGKTTLPTKSEIIKNDRFVLILDSSVCLSIVNFVQKRKIDKIQKRKIFTLLEYVQKTKLEVFSLMALLELCYHRTDYTLNEKKFWDLKNKIDFAFQFPVKMLKSNNFSFERNYFVYNKPKLPHSNINPLVEPLLLFYTSLLKIVEISKSGLGRQNTNRNIQAFITWMQKDLDLMLGLEFQLALQIFGGNTRFR